MEQKQYPLIEINPAHCQIYREYHDKKGRRHIQDGPYTVRRKVWRDLMRGKDFIKLQGSKVLVYPTNNTSPLAVQWETRRVSY